MYGAGQSYASSRYYTETTWLLYFECNSELQNNFFQLICKVNIKQLSLRLYNRILLNYLRN